MSGISKTARGKAEIPSHRVMGAPGNSG
jgi:hypothetical protein